MRILNVSYFYPPHISGQAAKVEAVSRHLRERGHDVTVLTTAPSGSLTGPSKDCVTVVRLPSLLNYKTLALSLGMTSFCRRHLLGFDVAHIYGIYDLLGPTVAASCRRWRVPYVLEPIGMFRPIVRSINLKRMYHWFLGRPMVMGASRVIATAELERNELIEESVSPETIVLRRNGVDLPSFERLPKRGTFRRAIGIADGHPLILYLGRLSRKKGLEVLVDAFAHVPAPSTLVVVGPDENDGSLQETELLCTRLGLNERMRVLGPWFGLDKWAVLSDADVFVLPSRSENFGNAAAEAVACGVPVIVTDRCGIASLVEGRAGLVVPFDKAALSEALRRLVGDASLRERFRRGAETLRGELSWDKPITQMEQLYAELIRGRRDQAAVAT